MPLALFLCSLIAGRLLYPFRSGVSTDQFHLHIDAHGTVGIVSLAMSETSSDHYNVNVHLVDASAPVDVKITFQFSLTTDCSTSRSRPCPRVHPAPPGDFGNVVKIRPLPAADVNFNVIASNFTFGSNGLTAEGWLPYVLCDSRCVGPTATPTVVRVVYKIPNGTGYDWTSGLPPGITKDHEPVWQQTPSQLQEPVLASGINAAAQQEDAFFIMLSGVFFGLAAAFLADTVRAVLELRKRHERSASEGTVQRAPTRWLGR
ncbi:MAG TPA: hypothetical protein VHS57_02870 [Acidimicrobiales bacterium]|nr:hypothetical protein [Acidimicrobiales bacterium]